MTYAVPWHYFATEVKGHFIQKGAGYVPQPTPRATPVRRANGLLYEDLVGGHQKSISSRGSKWAAILVGLPNFSPHLPMSGRAQLSVRKMEA